MEKRQAERETNIEVLRIISMILVIMHHYALYSGFEFDKCTTINKMLIDIISAFGKLGVSLFIIISGYFYDKTEFKIKKLFNIIIKVWIYSIIGLAIGVVTNSEKLNAMNIIKSIMPTIFGLYWFSNCYILIYLFSPFLKMIIEQIGEKELKKCLILMVIVWYVIALIPKTKTFVNEFINFIVIYLLGGYIKKYKISKFNNKDRIKYILVIILIQIILMVILELISIKIEKVQNYVLHFNSLQSPFVLLLTILIFNCFKEMSIKNNKIVNIIASSTFGIYLIHENVFLRDIIWKKMIQANKYVQSPFLIINAMIGVTLVFVICSLMEIFEQKYIQYEIIKLFEKINNKIMKRMRNDAN